MKVFDQAQAEGLSNNQIMAVICEGLAEFCQMIGNDPRWAHLRQRDIRRLESQFKGFQGLYESLALREQDK